jgi:WD40 repeat protein/class 3 adenylate cyclase
MEPKFRSGQQNKVEAFGRKHRTGLVTLLFTDMVGSTALKQQLGDKAAADLFRRHHDLIRETLRQFPQAEEIETAGDSFLLIFATPSDAVQFALLTQSRLRGLRPETKDSALDRIGIHVGEVVVAEAGDSHKPKDLFGIQIDTCSRVMSLAKAGQVLMTRAVFDSARQVLKGEDIEGVGQLEWLNHGPYLLKGIDEPVEICEVREQGQPTAGPPASSEKAQRQGRANEEPVLGWRPAMGQMVPNTRWVLEKKLGEGGFGEVWLGRHQTMKERRVFKFCFRVDRARSLKREMTLFRLIKERIGDHPNIVALREVYFEAPPFYVEEDYFAGLDLRTWCEAQGGVEKVPLEMKLEVVAQAAEGLEAAHESGVIHRDVKPGNILVSGRKTDGKGKNLEIKLTDFGIGQVVSEEALAGVTRAGFTMTLLGSDSSSQTGTHLYMAPELLAGKPASIHSDIYSLGVVLYQLVVGDFARPVTTDWAKRINDPLLREDLERCFAGEPHERFPNVELLAKSLRALEERRAILRKREAEIAMRERAAYRRGIMRTAGAAGVIVAVITGLALLALHQSKRAQAAAHAEMQERVRAEHQLYIANMNLAQQAWEQNNVSRVRQLLEETARNPERGFEWYYWQRQTHLALKTLRGHQAPILSVAFSPDGQRIVTGSGDASAKVWDIASGQVVFTLRGHKEPISSVAFSPDGHGIITGSWDREAILWDSTNGREKRRFGGEAEIHSVAFSPDGKRIVAGYRDHVARIWDAASGNLLLDLRGHSGPVWGVAFSPDGQRVVSGSGDKTVRIWDALRGRELHRLIGHAEIVFCVAVSPDGQRVVSGSRDDTAKVWDMATGKVLLSFERHGAAIYSTAFSSDGRRIASGSDDQTVRVWEASSGKELMTLRHGSKISSVAFSPDGQRIVSGGGSVNNFQVINVGTGDQTAKVWDASSDRESLTFRGHNGAVGAVCFSPNGKWIVTGGFDNTARIWECATGKGVLILKGHTAPVRSVTFSADGRRLLTGSFDSTAKIWESDTGRELLTLKGHTGWMMCAKFSPDGQRIATGGSDGTTRVWNATTGRELMTLRLPKALIWSVAFSPDGQRIVTANEDLGDDPHVHTGTVWDAANGTLLLTLKGHTDWLFCAAFSPDGKRIVTGSNDETARVWDSVSGREMLTLKGHSSGICSVTFSPDGKRIATGSQDHTAKVWDAATGKELLTFNGHADWVIPVAFSPDGRQIVTGSRDTTAKLWMAATGEQVSTWQKEEVEAQERAAVLERQ